MSSDEIRPSLDDHSGIAGFFVISGGNSDCLKDQPQKSVELPQSLPGQLYDGDDQCARAFGDGSRVCPAPFSKQVP